MEQESGGITIVAIDPGETVGLAVATVSPTNPTIRLSTTQVDMDDLYQVLEKVHNEMGVDTIVMERFLLYPGYGRRLHFSDFVTIEVIGAATLWAKLSRVPVVRQNAAGRTGMLPLSKQLVNRSGHEVDAVAHLLLYLHKKGMYEQGKTIFELEKFRWK